MKLTPNSTTVLCVDEDGLCGRGGVGGDEGVQLELSEDGWRDFPLLLACAGDCRLLSNGYPLLGVVIHFGNGQLL